MNFCGRRGGEESSAPLRVARPPQSRSGGKKCGSQASCAQPTADEFVFVCHLQRLSGPANVKWGSPRGVSEQLSTADQLFATADDLLVAVYYVVRIAIPASWKFSGIAGTFASRAVLYSIRLAHVHESGI